MSVIDYKLKQNIDSLTDELNQITNNPFKNKWISIISDSIGTFKDWTYASVETNDYYSDETPNNNDVKNVKDTWWHQLLTKLDAKLCVNCSVSDSSIYNDLLNRVDNKDFTRKAGNTYKNLDGNDEYCEEDIVPDYVIIFMGINDWNSTNELGNEYMTNDNEYYTRVPFSLYNWTKYKNNWDKNILGKYIHSIYNILTYNTASTGNPIRVIALSPILISSNTKYFWRNSNNSNEGIDSYINSMREIVEDVWRQLFIKSSNWIRGANKEYQDSTGFHANKQMMTMIADGMYKKLIEFPH
jgi:hypothetical protein